MSLASLDAASTTLTVWPEKRCGKRTWTTGCRSAPRRSITPSSYTSHVSAAPALPALAPRQRRGRLLLAGPHAGQPLEPFGACSLDRRLHYREDRPLDGSGR